MFNTPAPSSTDTTPGNKSHQRISAASSPSVAMQKVAHMSLIKTPGAGNKQLIIDAGQKNFGATECSLCSMVYSCNDPGDVAEHTLHHKTFMDALRFPGWKSERLVESLMNGRIIKVISSDPKFALQKLDQIRAVVDLDLGFTKPVLPERQAKSTYYLYVSDDQEVMSFVLAEPLSVAFRVLPRSSEFRDELTVCSRLPEPVTCGISRVWTNPKFRRRGCARRLLDAVRSSFVFGARLDKEQIAFSDPTPDGRQFAASYSGTEQFFTYHQNPSN